MKNTYKHERYILICSCPGMVVVVVAVVVVVVVAGVTTCEDVKKPTSSAEEFAKLHLSRKKRKIPQLVQAYIYIYVCILKLIDIKIIYTE